MHAAPQYTPDIPEEWTPPEPYLRPVPDLPPEPVPPIAEPPAWLGPLIVIIAFLTPTETAPPWMDELNPVTGRPYGSKQEYDDLRRLGPKEVRRRIWERVRQQAEQAQKSTSQLPKSDPLAVKQTCAEPSTEAEGI